MLRIKKIIIWLAVILLLTKIVILAAIFFYPKISPDDNLKTNAEEIIGLTNQYRESLGLNVLAANARLTQAAINKAKDMLSRQYFEHTSPEGKKFSQWIKEMNYNYFYVGENLAIDFENDQDIFRAWLLSPEHKANIIRPQYQEIGVAVLKGKFKNRPTTVAVQLFGTRVLSAQEARSDAAHAWSGNINNYFPEQSFLEKIISLDLLEKINFFINFPLIIFVGLAFFLYQPRTNSSQSKIKLPRIRR